MTDIINRVKFVPEAANEFRDSVEWYEMKAVGLGLRFIKEIDSTIERIKLNPRLYKIAVKDIRRIQVNKFPYSLFYQAEGNLLVILRVYHNRRRPIEW